MDQPNSLPPALTDRIPQEIYDSVIAAIGNDNQRMRTMGAISAVCHAWEASSRSYIFYSFSFTPTSLTFLAREAGNRVLMSIRCAKYEVKRDTNKLPEDFLQEVLPRMPNLHSLVFAGCEPKMIIPVARILSETGGRIMALDITGDMFRQVWSSFRTFQEMVALFPYLRTLSLADICWEGEVGGSHEGGNTRVELPSTLRSVNIWRVLRTPSLLLWLSPAAETIRSLQLFALRRSNLHLVPLFTHLQHLSLLFLTTPKPGDLAHTLSSCTMLKTLKVFTEIVLPCGEALEKPSVDSMTTTSPNNQLRQAPWYAELLSSVSSPLSKLSLQVNHRPSRKVDPMGWKILSDLFRSSPFYAELKQLEFNVALYDELWDSRSDCERSIRRELVGLHPGTDLSVGATTWPSPGFVSH
ncbi:hypothetical protein DFP72DRAFT_890788, partial [Ephemerocybe angulata]